MFLNKKKQIAPKIGNIVQALRASIDENDEKYRIVNQRLSYYQKFIIVDILILNNTKYARAIEITSSSSKYSNYLLLIKPKKLQYIKLDSLENSKTSFHDIYYDYETNVKNFLSEKYGVIQNRV